MSSAPRHDLRTRGDSPVIRRVLTQAGWEFALLVRNGEQLLLMIVIPIALLVAMRVGPAMLTEAVSPEAIIPTVVSVSVMAGSFTSLAIATGFERRSGALRFLATTPLRRSELLVGKLLAAGTMTGLSIVVVVTVGAILQVPGAQADSGIAVRVGTLIVGCLAWAALALLLAGSLRAEAVLAFANGIFVLALIFGGILNPPEHMGAVGSVIEWLPSAALADGLRNSSWVAFSTLCGWAVLGAVAAAVTFRWEDR